jgi:hypothetical protein
MSKEQKDRKSGGLKCVYKSLFRIIVPKKAHFVEGGIEMVESIPEREDAQSTLQSHPSKNCHYIMLIIMIVDICPLCTPQKKMNCRTLNETCYSIVIVVHLIRLVRAL